MKRLSLLLLLLPLSARAATFLVPSDRDLVNAAKAIVVATAGESAGRRAPGGWIETVTALHVEEVIKGPIAAGETIHVTELGGVDGSLRYLVAGSPTYAPGERVLLFLETNGRSEWVSKNMAVGKFTARGGFLVRAQLCGWDYDGTPHLEPLRDEEKFLRYVRDTARGVAATADYVVSSVAASEVAAGDVKPSTYLLQWPGAQGTLGIRWNRFPAPVVFYSHGTQPGATGGGLPAAQRGLAAWTNDPNSNIVYTYGGTTSIASAGFAGGGADGTNVILFNDPSDEIPGAFTGTGGDTLAIGGAWFDDSSPASTHTFGSERFYTIYEADLVVQNGIFGGGLTGLGFDHVLTHELGHTLGLRHSDSPPAGGTFSATAIMASSVFFNGDPYGSNLQRWDRDAIAAVYGSGIGGTPACKPPQIVAQPQSVALAGAPVMLSVGAIGDAPLSYQWYTGARGNTASPINGAITSAISVQPAVSTVYWARVSNGCDPFVDSAAATVTVNGCAAVTVDSVSPNVEIIEGSSVTLTASATGATTFQWYGGVSGATFAPIPSATAASISVSPAVTTTYWVRPSNGCGAFADSETVVVGVRPCKGAHVALPPAGGSVLSGGSATLYATATGSDPLAVQWYEGLRGDVGRPMPNGNAPTLTTPPIFAPASYWVRISNLCGSDDSTAAAVTIAPSCSAPVITAQPRDAAVAAGSRAVVTVAATGTSLTYQWYEGAVFDFTKPVGGSAPSLLTPPIDAAIKFWVRIASPCGSVNSVAATVSTGMAGKRRAAGR